MFGLVKRREQQSVIQLPNNRPPAGHYNYRSTGISVDWMYKPESFTHEMIAGGYGEPVSFTEVMQRLGEWPSETFLGLRIIGTDAGRYLGKRLMNHFENFGFGHGFMFDQTKVIAIIPLKDAAGCGECPGSAVVVSPGGFSASIDTLFHEYCHNIGLDHKYGPGGLLDQQDIANDPIYINARKVASYLSQFPEA